MAEPALIFIPDISGFTRFVTRTEEQHANHIISELLGVILESNQLGLELSEIEGDAVLYYRMGRAPSVGEVLSQIERTFIDFHEFLKIIDRDRVCQCGACTTASGLTLKFVAHYGRLDEVRVRDHLKLMGSDVILAHRLLKNEVPGHEYALITQPLLEAPAPADAAPSTDPHGAHADWAAFHGHREAFDEFGTVHCTYVPLSPLRDRVPEPGQRRPLGVGGGRGITLDIDAPLDRVHEAVTDFRERLQWTPGLKDSVSEGPINRVGGTHTCVFPDLEVHLVTVDHQAAQGAYHYAESAEVGGVTLVTDYQMKAVDGGTRLTVSLVLGQSRGTGGPLARMAHRVRAGFLLWNARRAVARSLKGLKAYAERTAARTAEAGHREAAAAGDRA